MISLRTQRLTLRPPTLADARAIFETWAGDPEVTRYMGWPRHTALDVTERIVTIQLEEWDRHGTGTFLIELDGRLVGSTGCHVDGEGLLGTGYILGKPWWGHGYATEACRAMVEHGRTLGARRIESYCYAGHQASARVLEKAGFQLVRIARDELVFPNLSPALQDVREYAIDF